MLERDAPIAEPNTVYIFHVRQDDGSHLRAVLIHQHGDTWTQEYAGKLLLARTASVQVILSKAYDDGVPIVALGKEEFFRRLHEAAAPSPYARRN